MRMLEGPETDTCQRAPRRRRGRLIAAALAIAIIGAACGPSVAAGPPACVGPGAPPDAISSGVLAATNNDRAANGLAPLQWNAQLWCLASAWSTQIAGNGTLTHRDLNATIRSAEYASYRTLGENLLRGPAALAPESMEVAWMNSSGHRANVLSAQFTSAAVAYTMTGDGQVFVTVNFGG